MSPRLSRRACLLAFLLLLAPATGAAQDAGAGDAVANPSGLPIPRWVSLRAETVNLRTGPGVRYPIDWVLTRKGLPIEVIGEFEAWRRIHTPDGTRGWIHRSMLSGRRMAVVADGGTRLLREPASGAAVAAFVEPGVLGRLEACKGAWCRIALDGFEVGGWIPRQALWGVYDDESLQ